jgi:hypothetical protein
MEVNLMRKVGIMAVSALVLSLLFAGITFASEGTLPGETNFNRVQGISSEGSDPAGMMIGQDIQAPMEYNVQTNTADENKVGFIRDLHEFYGVAPSWGVENNAVPAQQLGINLQEGN